MPLSVHELGNQETQESEDSQWIAASFENYVFHNDIHI